MLSTLHALLWLANTLSFKRISVFIVPWTSFLNVVNKLLVNHTFFHALFVKNVYTKAITIKFLPELLRFFVNCNYLLCFWLTSALSRSILNKISNHLVKREQLPVLGKNRSKRYYKIGKFSNKIFSMDLLYSLCSPSAHVDLRFTPYILRTWRV